MLKHDHRDIGKVFKKHNWGNDLMFSWCEDAGYYGYCFIADVKGNGVEELVFKAPYHEGNRKAGYKVSRVGDGVLGCNLKLIKDFNKEKKMGKNVDYIGGKYNVVECEYEVNGKGSHTDFFKIDADMVVTLGGLFVVENSSGLDIVRVVKYHEKNTEIKTMKVFNKAKAWIVDVIDERRQNQRREASERRVFITKQLQEKKEAMEEIAIYKLLAESDPDAAKLLEELKQLGQ